MAVYVISDIHGNYDLFMELLKKIKFSEKDTLYVLGDVVDRGPHPIKVLHKLMEMPNAFCLVGNHELMAIRCLEFLMQEITEDSIEHMNEGMIQGISEWQMNGSSTTMQEFRTLNREEQEDVLDFMKDFSVCEELQVAGKKYFLVHAGLGNYSPEKDIDDYTLKEMLWDRADYDTQYFPDTYVVKGHTPTQHIAGNPNPGYIYRKNNHIAIDCGACLPGGRLAAICLDSGEEFYVSSDMDCKQE